MIVNVNAGVTSLQTVTFSIKLKSSSVSKANLSQKESNGLMAFFIKAVSQLTSPRPKIMDDTKC